MIFCKVIKMNINVLFYSFLDSLNVDGGDDKVTKLL